MAEGQSDRDTGRRKEVRAMLVQEDASSVSGSMGRLLMGLGACLLLGLVIATLITLVLNAIAGTSLIHWGGWFLVYVLVLVGLLIWLERRPRTVNLEDARRELSPNQGGHESHALLPVGAYAKKVVWGPQAVLDGLRGVRGRRTAQQEAVFDRAAVLVIELSKTDGGVPIRQLLNPPENMQIFGSAVDWLEPNDWVGRSSDGGSLWLSSAGRRKLIDRKLMPAPGEII